VGVPNDTVSFTVSGSSCGSNTSVTKTTDANGKAAYPYTAAGTAGTCTVTAIEASAGLTNSATVTQTPVKNLVAVTPPSANVRANGATQGFSAKVTRQVGGGNVAGDTVAFTLSGGAACGSVSPTSGTTDTTGNVATTYTASTTVGFCTLTATDTSSTPTQFASGGTGTASITQTAGVVGNTTAVTAGTNPVPADNVSTSTLTIQVTGTANFNDPVMLTTGSNAACGTVSPTTVATDGTGKFTATYTASAVGGTCVVTATEANGGSPGSVTITQTPQKNNVALTASPNPIPGNGTSTSTFTATVTRAVGGAAVVGDTVTFALGSQAACTGATLGTASNAGKTDANGQVTVTYTSSTTSGFCTVTATDTAVPAGDVGKYLPGGTNTFTITQS
jgi:hypothetical protein